MSVRSAKKTWLKVEAKGFRPPKSTRKRRRPAISAASGGGFKSTGPSVSLTTFNKSLPFPRMKRYNLVYEYTTNLNSTSSSATFGASSGLNLNSCYAPQTSGGHQPLGYDQICNSSSMYERFKVYGVKGQITFFGLGGGDSATDQGRTYGGMIWNNPSNNQDVNGLTIERVEELPQGQVVHIEQYGSSEASIKFSFKMHQLFNWTKQQFANEITNSTGAYNSSPATIPKAYFGICTRSAPTASVNCYAKVRLVYSVMMYTRDVLAQS